MAERGACGDGTENGDWNASGHEKDDWNASGHEEDDEGVVQTPRGNQPAVIESDAGCISVDAGAGTGKTTTMVMRIERAIERGEVAPSDVLIVTFANEAASNIRESVATRLDPAVAAEIDVYTYHSLCYRLVREYAYYLGLSPSFEIVTERGRRRLLNRLLAERDYEFAAIDVAPDESPTAATLAGSVDRFVSMMSREDIDPETLEDVLPEERTLDLLEELLLWLRREASSLTFENEALRYFNRDEHLEAARESLLEYGTLLTFCREKIAEAPAAFRESPIVREVDTYLRTLQSCVTRVRETLTLDDPTTKQLPRVLFTNQLWRRQTETIEQTPIGRLEHYVAFLRQARHYTAIYADYRATLETDGAVDFDELVRLATRLLEDDAVAEEVVDRWSQVYCDEFQDTDRTQWTLVTELTRGPERPDLLAIGDTDQSIYGWRGTDPRGLERLGEEYEDHEAIELELNFRSKQEILELTNRCSYGPQTSKTLREDGREPETYDEPDPPNRLLKVESDDVGITTPEQVGSTISRLLNGDAEGVPERTPADVAVIVRTNAQAGAIADELSNRQIPFERAGSPAGTISPGVQTVLSYLRVLVDRDADVHLRRVLSMRYRVPERDLTTLGESDRRLYDVLLDLDLDQADEQDAAETGQAGDRSRFEAPGRLRQARADLECLAVEARAYPLTPFLRRFRDRTRIEWFIEPADRRAFDRIERFVDAYDGNDALSSLSASFVDALERAVRGGSTDRRQGTTSVDAVDVMTVHQAKGLQFDTVLVPYLSDEEWCVRSDYAYSSRYRLLTAFLDEDVDSPLVADLAVEPLAESWRVLHVALTRAERHLYVFGSSYDYEGEEDAIGTSTVDACLAPEIEWSSAGERMDLWAALTDAFDQVATRYPASVADVTDALADTATDPTGVITYERSDRYSTLEPGDAVDVVNWLGRLLRRDTLLSAADAADVTTTVDPPTGRRLGSLTSTTARFSNEALSNLETDVPAALRHSYSALETYGECPRKHYLDHVVGAVDDPRASGVWSEAGQDAADLDAGLPETDSDPPADSKPPAGADATGSHLRPRLVGTVFHAVAEEAFYRGYTTNAEWKTAATRQLTARGHVDHEPAVHRCIDRYFEADSPAYEGPLWEWEELAAELSFTVDDVPGVDGTVVGYVDTVRRSPNGDLVVLDYKATRDRIAPGEAVQLALYARACERRLGESVDAVGYVYVGPVGDDGEDVPASSQSPRVALHDPADVPAWDAVRDALEALDRPTVAETTPGDHCRRCPHRSLGCGPDAGTGNDAD